ncbi:hypothetical protein PY650_18395 [Rhizobium calliandrae]|uniref:Uncharacterized protein n=1 Tax=Rhizobium calliandrae TaxID=1312182 RepID=A0ABT7KI23_9HYPH|nr:hypothetical protein [Rhizobium calliandrae]MDL2407598.1 hypothetical protein [Rhizobium calliandrae]
MDAVPKAAAVLVKDILAAVKPLAAEYYRISGKPLGVTGEIAEYIAGELLGLELVPPRTAGYDALRHTAAGLERVLIKEIKGRAYDPAVSRTQRIGTIKPEDPCDVVMLVLLHNGTLDPVEIWEVSFSSVFARLAEPGSKSRNERGALAVSDFKRIGSKIWPTERGS